MKFNKFVLVVSLRNLGYGFEFAPSGKLKPVSTGELKVIKYLLKQNLSVVFDIGANSGHYSKQFFKHRGISVYAFEPELSAFAKLSLLSLDYVNLIPVNLALGRVPGFLPLFVSQANTELSTLNSQVSSVGFAKKLNQVPVDVEVSTLDLYMKTGNLKIDFLKIDVEGYEMELLAGAKELLKTTL